MRNRKCNRANLRFIGALFISAFSASLAVDVTLNINVKKASSVISEKFLSLTLDPASLFTSDALSEKVERTMNMAKALSPAFIRIAGPSIYSLKFLRDENEPQDSYTFIEGHWHFLNQWAERAGLDIIIAVPPRFYNNAQSWDLRNAEEIIANDSPMELKTNWQLGYECQIWCNATAEDLGAGIRHLRKMLDVFPRYSNSIITGPDVVAYKTRQQQQFLRDYLDSAGSALSAITWHPKLESVIVKGDSLEIQPDNLMVEKRILLDAFGNSLPSIPLWIAESKPETSKSDYLGALIWTKRLGEAAKLGIQVVMRQYDSSSFFQPTPDYWVSVLHKILVGRKVLDTKILTGNRTLVHVFCQCTKPSAKYRRGSLTIFGINIGPTKVKLRLNEIKISTVHKYVLLPGYDNPSRIFSKTVLLNDLPLEMDENKFLPVIKPLVLNHNETTLDLAAGSIGFFVFPDVKVLACMNDDETQATEAMLARAARKAEVGQELFATNETILESMRNQSAPFATNESKKAPGNGIRKPARIEPQKRLERLENVAGDKTQANATRNIGQTQDRNDPSKAKTSLEPRISYGLLSNEEIRAKLQEYKQQLSSLRDAKREEPRDRITARALRELEETQKSEAETFVSEIEWILRHINASANGAKLNPRRRRDLAYEGYRTGQKPELDENAIGVNRKTFPFPIETFRKEPEEPRITLADERAFPRDEEYEKSLYARKTDLNSLFGEEMISQDDDNAKDCKCRVIRKGLKICPSCKTFIFFSRTRRNAPEKSSEKTTQTRPETQSNFTIKSFFERLEILTSNLKSIKNELTRRYITSSKTTTTEKSPRKKRSSENSGYFTLEKSLEKKNFYGNGKLGVKKEKYYSYFKKPFNVKARVSKGKSAGGKENCVRSKIFKKDLTHDSARLNADEIAGEVSIAKVLQRERRQTDARRTAYPGTIKIGDFSNGFSDIFRNFRGDVANEEVENEKLTTLIIRTLPKLEALVTDSLGKAKFLSGILKSAMDEYDRKHGRSAILGKLVKKDNSYKTVERVGIAKTIDNAYYNIKKFLTVLSTLSKFVLDD